MKKIKTIEAENNQKYIICDVAEAKWGKTTALNHLIDVMARKGSDLIMDPKITAHAGDDRRRHFDCPSIGNKKVVVSTIGDWGTIFVRWLNAAINAKADIIVAACRPGDRSQCYIIDTADKNGYEIIWFKNFRFDNSVLLGSKEYKFVKEAEANGIVEMIKDLLK